MSLLTSFQYNSCTFVPEPDSEPIVRHVTPRAAVAVRHPEPGYHDVPWLDVHWGAKSAESLIEALRAVVGTCPALAGALLRADFVPPEFESALAAIGFATTSEWTDRWLSDLQGYPLAPTREFTIVPLTAENALAAAAVTRASRFTSRDYLGESDAFVVGWLGEVPNGGFVCLCEGKAVGVALTTLYGQDSPKGLVCWLRELVVAPSHRRRGIGRELALTVLEWGRAKGATRSFLAVDAENPAIRLYEALGYRGVDARGQINMMAVANLSPAGVSFGQPPQQV